MVLAPPYLLLIFTSIAGAIILSTLRLLAILPPYRSRPKKRRRDESRPARILIVLGSGGHTAEMLAMLERVDMQQFKHRTYLVSSGDSLSADKARAFEAQLQRQLNTSKSSRGVDLEDDAPMVASRMAKQSAQRQRQAQQASLATAKAKEEQKAQYTIHVLPRARRIHQSVVTAPYTCALTLYAALSLLHNMPYPDIILTNGPATGVIVILASLILRFFDIADVESEGRAGHFSEEGRGLVGGDMRTIYVESWARVSRLSLSGKVLLRLVDRFLVQWERLEEGTQGRAEYKGVLV